IKIFVEKDYVEGEAKAQKNLGDVYLDQKVYGQATEAYRRAMQLKIDKKDILGASDIANLLGNISINLGDYDSSLAYFQMGLDLDNSLGEELRIASDYANLTLSYLGQGELEEAQENNDRALRMFTAMDDRIAMASCYKNRGQIFAEKGDRKNAAIEFDRAGKTIRKVKNQKGASELLESIAVGFKSIGDYNKAYRYQMSYSKSRDAFFKKEKAEALVELTTRYQSEFQAEKQKATITSLEQQQDFNIKLTYFMVALLGLGAVLLFVLFNSFKRKQKDNETLTLKNKEIQRQKEEINEKAMELEDTNSSLDLLNQKLVEEIAERETIEKSSFARDRFLATMSHEMRTPMNIIIGLAHLLLEEEPRTDQVDHLRTLLFSANNLTVFINDVLDFSKIEAGKLNLESRIFDPVKTFQDTAERYSLPARDKGIELKYHYDSKLPGALMGDPTRLNQIISNLVSNAINYSEEGEVNVDVSLHNLDNRDATLLITIQDSGNGIPEEKLEEMFRKFDRNNQDIFEGYAGSGLGLAITKRLVDLQNGKIEAHSTEGIGTTFTIYLPYKMADEQYDIPSAFTGNQEPREKGDFSHLSGQKILLVEDNKINQLVVAKLLRKLGIEVVPTENGVEALEAFDESYFDLVLMDIQMPIMDGYRTTAEIRKSSDPRKRDVPIIALTASAFLTEKEKAKLFGMNDHVGKPFGPEELLEKISACLAVYKNIK
ncbi:MAG: response regulator, partial [Saprospiraceae bacterium]|nr:response regulator [Saprospiraceae bacterium]